MRAKGVHGLRVRLINEEEKMACVEIRNIYIYIYKILTILPFFCGYGVCFFVIWS